jgi:mono/diheme cytochrome c family protein
MKGSLSALAALSLLCAAGSGVRADSAGFSPSGTGAPLNGEQIYTQICQGCHMPGGQGAVGAGFYPKLAANPKFISWEFVALTVLNGRNGMPPFGLPQAANAQVRALQLSDAQVAEVVNYVRGHFDNRHKPTVTAQQVAALRHPSNIIMPF